MNILVPSPDRTGYCRDQKPVTHFGTQALHTSRSASPFPPVQGKGHLDIHGRTFLYPPLPSPQTLLSVLELRCLCAIPGAGHSWAGLPLPLPPASSVLAGLSTPPTSTTRACHLEEQETGTRKQRCPPGDIPTPRRVLVT